MNIYELTSTEQELLKGGDASRADAFLAITRVIEKLAEEYQEEQKDELGTRSLNLQLSADDVGFGIKKSL